MSCMPSQAEQFYRTKWTTHFADLLHAVIDGAWIQRSHSFSKILGPTKTISFIFPYYGKRKEIPNAIATLKKQKFNSLRPDDIEIIVVEDGSQDDLDEVLDPDIIYVRRNKFGYGISRSRNLGAKISSGKILCFLDPDFDFPEDYVENLYGEYLKYGPDTVVTGYICDYFYEGCEDPRAAFGVWDVADRKTRRFLHLAGGHMFIDRNVFFQVGGFDEDLIYGEVEDTYFGFQLSKEVGLSIVFSTKWRVRHLPHPTGLAHGRPDLSFKVAAFKSPEFYKRYALDGER